MTSPPHKHTLPLQIYLPTLSRLHSLSTPRVTIVPVADLSEPSSSSAESYMRTERLNLPHATREYAPLQAKLSLRQGFDRYLRWNLEAPDDKCVACKVSASHSTLELDAGMTVQVQLRAAEISTPRSACTVIVWYSSNFRLISAPRVTHRVVHVSTEQTRGGCFRKRRSR